MSQNYWNVLTEFYVETAADMLMEKARDEDGSDAVDVPFAEGRHAGARSALIAVYNTGIHDPASEAEIEKMLTPFEVAAVDRARRILREEYEIKQTALRLRSFLNISEGE